MDTTIWHIGINNRNHNEQESVSNKVESYQDALISNTEIATALQEAARILRDGGLVAFPTETVYGLGADARNSAAVARIFEAKGRPSDNPLIVHIASEGQLEEIVLPYPRLASNLMERFWPGPLTIILPVKPGVVSPLVTANLSTVGIRMPDHAVALELLKQAGCPVAAPSANRSGRPSPTLASHVVEDLNGRIDGIVDGGAAGVGLESTVIELEGEQSIRILRPGGVTAEALREAFPGMTVTGVTEMNTDDIQHPRSPGMKYTHYAPKGQLTVVHGPSHAVITYINEQANTAKQQGQRTGILAFSERASSYHADLVLDMGSMKQLDKAAHRLYAHLRQFDEAGIECIWSEASASEGIGGALMNRIEKAAGGMVIRLDK